MTRIAFWFLVTLSVVVLLFGYDGSRSSGSTAAPPSALDRFASDPPAGRGGADDPRRADATEVVTGRVAYTVWGPVQVRIAVTGGRITSVSVPRAPSGTAENVRVNDYALPILTESTEAAQSADIDMVSGATVTSTGYLQSLQSAIDQAGL